MSTSLTKYGKLNAPHHLQFIYNIEYASLLVWCHPGTSQKIYLTTSVKKVVVLEKSTPQLL